MRKTANVKGLAAFLCLSVLLLMLCACSDRRTAAKPAPIVSAPVTELTCIAPKDIPTFQAAGGGSVLACWSDYEAATTYLRIIDIAKDAVTASSKLDGCLELFPETFSDGGFVLRDRESSRWLFLDAKLNELATFPAESMDGFFTHDRKRFYYLEDSLLRCVDTATGDALPVDLPLDLRFCQIAGFHPTENIVALHVYTSPFSTTCGTAILDLYSGSFSMLQSRLYQTTFGKEQTMLLHFDDEAMQYEVTYCGSEGAGYVPASRFARVGELTAISGADYLVGTGDATELFRLSGGVSSCSLAENGISGELRNVCGIDEGGLLVGSVWRSTSAAIYVLCPELLPFSEAEAAQGVATPLTVDSAIAEGYWGRLSGDALPESMQGLRQLADRIERTYNVQILLSDQCEELAQHCYYDLVLTGTMSEAEELERTGYFLGALESSLAMYPDGFFDQFRSTAEDGGVCFMPVEQVISDKGIVGICFATADWYAIALDVRRDSMTGLFCHEIWHAVEYKILGDDYTEFSDEVWAQFNPEGFHYNEDRDTPDAAPTRWTLFDSAEGVYFIDDYARTNDMEDRARLMEYAMAIPEYREQLKASPALMAKLRYMCDAVRRHFDTTGWRETPWEAVVG